MSASMSKKIQSQGLLSSSLRIEEETMLVQKQGIVTILGSDCETNRAAATSLRRTLSGDMSCKKWLSQNGLKKIASSEELSSHSKLTTACADSLSSSEGEDDYEEMMELDQIWSSIQRDKKEEQQQHEKPTQFDLWSSILSQKTKEETSNSLAVTPYIHPLVKRSKTSLSQKSLEICTESLGSETGSDGFSSYPPSESGKHSEVDKEEEEQEQQQQLEEVTVLSHGEELQNLQVPKYNYAAKKSSPRCFPPPLPSLHSMLSHRDNGRLFLEAVSLPSQDNFWAQRQDGRLVLTFASHPEEEESKEDDGEVAEEEEEEEDHVEELEEEFVGFVEDAEEEKELEDDDEAEEDEIEEIESGAITSVHWLALMMNKLIGLVDRNPELSDKLNQVVNFEDDVDVVQHSPIAHSLPPSPRVARLIPSTTLVASAASFNAYEYYWRTKPSANTAPVPIPLTHQQNNYTSLKNNSSKLTVSGDIDQTSNGRQQLLVLRGKNGDYLVHHLKSCKDSRRSFLFWEPYCIAT